MALFRPRPRAVLNLVQTARCLTAGNLNSFNLLPLDQAHKNNCLCPSSVEGPSTSYLSVAPTPPWGSCRTFFSQFTSPNGKAYKERRLIGYSPDQLYAVVSNVQHYHQFVPWCVGSNILKQNPDGSYLEAELQIGFQMIHERYTSRVKLQAPHTVSSTVANSALFHHLESTWHMKPGPNPDTTWLSFSVDFAFMNPLYANIAQLFFSEVVTRMMGAFEGRCKQLYGPPSFSPAGQRHMQQHPKQQRHGQPHLHLQQHHKMQALGKATPDFQHTQEAAAAVVTGSNSAGSVVQSAPAEPRRNEEQPERHQQNAGSSDWHSRKGTGV